MKHKNIDDSKKKLAQEIHQVIDEFITNDAIALSLDRETIINDVLNLSWIDLCSLAKRDPSAKENLESVLNSYLSFKAVMYYRLAHRLFYSFSNTNQECNYLRETARKISEKAKVLTGIEIHPAAKIGSGFVIDHGLGTLIGETCEIGNNCYLLQNVILGAMGIADNDRGKRHPTLGNNVQVGAFAKILGAIKIGDHVEISPGSIVYKDIPPNTRVVVTNELQIHKKLDSNLQVYGVILEEDEKVCIMGKGLESAKFYVVDANNFKLNHLKILIYEMGDKIAKIGFDKNSYLKDGIKDLRLSIESGNSQIMISNSLALRQIGFGG